MSELNMMPIEIELSREEYLERTSGGFRTAAHFCVRTMLETLDVYVQEEPEWERCRLVTGTALNSSRWHFEILQGEKWVELDRVDGEGEREAQMIAGEVFVQRADVWATVEEMRGDPEWIYALLRKIDGREDETGYYSFARRAGDIRSLREGGKPLAAALLAISVSDRPEEALELARG
jgi:hypothetical protein